MRCKPVRLVMYCDGKEINLKLTIVKGDNLNSISMDQMKNEQMMVIV